MPAVLRRAAVAGSWYPGTAAAIAEEVDRTSTRRGRSPPRAGSWPSSARTRACATRGPSPPTATRCCVPGGEPGRARGSPSCWWGPRTGRLSTASRVHARGAWETPLGRAPIDEELARGPPRRRPHRVRRPRRAPRRALARDADAVPAAARARPAHRAAAHGHASRGTRSRPSPRPSAKALAGAPRAPRGLERPLALPAGRRGEPDGRRGRRRRWTASTRRRSWPASRRTTTWPAAAGRWWR